MANYPNNQNALQQAWDKLKSVADWIEPPPISPLAEDYKHTLAEPGGFKQAVNNVMAGITGRPQLIRKFPPSTLGQNTVHTLKDLGNRILPGDPFGATPLQTSVPVQIAQRMTSVTPTVTPTASPNIFPTAFPTVSPTVTPTIPYGKTQFPTTVPVSPNLRTPSATPTPVSTARNPSVAKFNILPVVQTAINQAAETYNIPASLLYDIALQESSFNPGLINTTPAGVKAGNPTGLFQFTDGTWRTVLNYANRPNSTLKLPTTDRLDPLTNALAAAYLIAHGQLGRWDASKNVWGGYYNEEELTPFYSQTLNRRK